MNLNTSMTMEEIEKEEDRRRAHLVRHLRYYAAVLEENESDEVTLAAYNELFTAREEWIAAKYALGIKARMDRGG